MPIEPSPHDAPATRRARRWCTTVAAVAVAASLVVCGMPNTGTPDPTPEPSTLRIGVQGSIDDLDPREPGALLQVLMLAMEPLLHLTAERELRPALATAWSVEDDGRTIRLTLRDGVTFHDGTAFGAEDVRFTLEALLGDDLETVDTPGPLEAVLRFATPSAPVLYDLPRLPILPSEAVTGLADPPIGTGPYAFVAPTAGTPLTLERFDAYWGPLAHHEVVEVHAYAFDFAVQEAIVDGLLDGGLDLVQGVLARERIDRLRDASGVTVQRIPSLDRQFLLLNTAVGPLDDVRLRRAIDLLMPRDAIFGGFTNEAFPVSTLLGDGTPWSDGAPPRASDPAQAQTLLDDVGPIGRTLTLHTNADPNRLGAAATLRDTLAPYGIDIDVVEVEFGELLDRAANGDFDLLLLGTVNDSNPVASALWTIDPQGLFPAPTFSTTRIAELADAVRGQDVGSGQGADDFRELLGLLADDAVYVYIAMPSVYGAFAGDLTGWAPHPDRGLSLQDVHRIPVR